MQLRNLDTNEGDGIDPVNMISGNITSYTDALGRMRMNKKKCANLAIMFVFAMVFLLASCSQFPFISPLKSNKTDDIVPQIKNYDNSDNLYETEVSNTNETAKTQDNNYLGTWYTDDYKLDTLTIFEIYADKIGFEMGIFRITNIVAFAIIDDNNEYKFFGSEGGAPVGGTLKLTEDSILVVIDEAKFEHIKAGTSYNFVVKESMEMPDQSFIGTWYCKDNDNNNELAILDINKNAITFEMDINGSGRLKGMAIIGESHFMFFVYPVPESISKRIVGLMDFNENSITVTIAVSNVEGIEGGKEFVFLCE